jgi:hypothetical protein
MRAIASDSGIARLIRAEQSCVRQAEEVKQNNAHPAAIASSQCFWDGENNY